jgi:hypothetical protein
MARKPRSHSREKRSYCGRIGAQPKCALPDEEGMRAAKSPMPNKPTKFDVVMIELLQWNN